MPYLDRCATTLVRMLRSKGQPVNYFRIAAAILITFKVLQPTLHLARRILHLDINYNSAVYLSADPTDITGHQLVEAAMNIAGAVPVFCFSNLEKAVPKGN